MISIKLIGRSSLSGPAASGAVEIQVNPGGDLLACVTSLWTSIRGGAPNQTAIDLWSILDPESPRIVLRMRTKIGFVATGITLEETSSSTVGRLMLTCRSWMDAVDPVERYIVECYDVDLADTELTLLGVEPPYERILADSRQYIPPCPWWDAGARTDVAVSHVFGDMISCRVRYFERPRGCHDESRGPYKRQSNPRIPLPGFEQVYLVHLSARAGRWIHRRHVESFIDVQAYIHADHLYLLGRTPSTFVIRDYQFSEDMILSSFADHAADHSLDLGNPLAECESGLLPDARLPFGDCDRQTVHFDPIRGFTILQLHDWYGMGQVLRLPLPTRSPEHPAAQSRVFTFAYPHLPGASCFGDVWLGRKHALICSEDDYHGDHSVFFRLTFDFGGLDPDDAANRFPDAAAAVSPVIREDLPETEDEDDQDELWALWRPFAFDERSGRLCVSRRHTRTEVELFVFSLQDR